MNPMGAAARCLRRDRGRSGGLRPERIAPVPGRVSRRAYTIAPGGSATSVTNREVRAAMGDFRYERRPIAEETKEERSTTFGEILHSYSKEEAILEAQRCLQCQMPFCVQACPITQDCRGYITLIAQDKFDEAAVLTLQDNPLATVLCKTCYHYCEEDCVMGGKGLPIAIRHLKRAALEHGNSDLLYVSSRPRDERIAVIGGGPAGLMAAWELAVRGYSVTVYEEQPFLGGQVETIPKYHLAGDELATDLDRFKNLDVTFRLGSKAGTDYTPESLLKAG